ncbi:hypothetical protein H9P43_008375 [Blastocladiella emersonii ATCC 22665]|nr:hypothetical protein H9P43_008375 [Blastocladiella emersonii ATCC 22665]
MAPAPNVNPALFVSRMAGLITSVPSILLTISVLNSVLQRFKKRPLQFAIVGSGVMSIATDVLILVTLVSWAVDPSFPQWIECLITLSLLKRVHSICTVYLGFLRTTAVVRPLMRAKKLAIPYTLLYAAFGCISVGFQIDSYVSSGWNAAKARNSASFLSGYRPFNLVCVLYYAVPAIATDLYFLLVTSRSSNMSKRFDAVRAFYNPLVYVFIELVMLFCVVVPLILGMSNPDHQSPTYTEQFLLSAITLNSTMSVKAAVLMPGDVTANSAGTQSTSTAATARAAMITRTMSAGTGTGATTLGVTTIKSSPSSSSGFLGTTVTATATASAMATPPRPVAGEKSGAATAIPPTAVVLRSAPSS